MELCAILLSSLVVGAYEFKPGIMRVDLMNFETEQIEELIVYTDDYIQCWERQTEELNSPGN